jgi:hypothetical protein
MDKSKKSKQPKSSSEEVIDDRTDFNETTPEVTRPSSRMGDILDSHRKSRDQQIEELQNIIEEQSHQLQLTQEALQASQETLTAHQTLSQRTSSNTPSPNQNTPSPERPQDIAYKHAIEEQANM